MIMASTFVATATEFRNVDVNRQLPFAENYTRSPNQGLLQVSITLENVTEYTILYAWFNRSQAGADQGVILRSAQNPGLGEYLGNIEAGYNVFSVPIEEDSILEFSVADWTWIRIDRATLDATIPPPTYSPLRIQYTGKLYREEFQRPVGPELRGHRALLEFPPVTAVRLAAQGKYHRLEVDAADGHANDRLEVTTWGWWGGATGYWEVATDSSLTADLGPFIRFLKVYGDQEGRFRAVVSPLVPDSTPTKERKADLYSSSMDISWTDRLEWQVIETINVNVTNIGDEMSLATEAELHLDTVSGDASRLDTSNIPSLAPGETTQITFDWSVDEAPGAHVLRVLLDSPQSPSLGLVDEWNETNLASRLVFVEGGGASEFDGDNDGIPDYWETLHDLDPQDEFDGAEDPDGDGLTNFMEYQALSNPQARDTDGDGLADGTNNTLVRLVLTQVQLSPSYIPASNAYYLRMHEYRWSDGTVFPYAGYRVPPTSPGFWFIPPGGTINLFDDLLYAPIVPDVPLNFYNDPLSYPIAQFVLTVGLEGIPSEGLTMNFQNENVSLDILALRVENAYADPDPLLHDADWDGIRDPQEAYYLSSRTLDFRGYDVDADGVTAIADVDGDADGLTDGIELSVYTHPGHADPRTYGTPTPSLLLITDPTDWDTDNDLLSDGDEIREYGADPHNPDTDGDTVLDGDEVDDVFPAWNATVGKTFWNRDSAASLNLSHLMLGFIPLTYIVTVPGMATVNASTLPLVDHAVNVTLGRTPIAHGASMPPRELTDAFERVPVMYTFSLGSDVGSDLFGDRLGIRGNGSVFASASKFQVRLDYAMFEVRGTSPLFADTDRDDLRDDEERAYGLSPVASDTDFDRLWDKAEVDFWTLKFGAPLPEALDRARTADVDGDGMWDGDEAFWTTDPTNPDSDGDGLDDLQETNQFVTMWRRSLDRAILHPDLESFVDGAACGGWFPGSLLTSDDYYRCIREGNTGGAGVTSHTPTGESFLWAVACGGTFPGDLQASDNLTRCVREKDAAPPDGDHVPGAETVTLGTRTGTFPADLAVSDDVYVSYAEENVAPGDVDRYPLTETIVTGAACGGSFPQDIQASEDAYRCYEEATASPNIDTYLYPMAGTSSYYNTWDSRTGCTPSTHYDCVEEEPPDDVTSYVQTGTTSEKEAHVMTDLSIPAGYMDIDVTWEARCQRAASQAGGQISHLVRETDGTAEEDVGADKEFTCPSGSWQTFTYFMEQSPGGGEWTPAEVNALQCGYRSSTDVSPQPRVTRVRCRVQVTYPYQLEVRHDWSGIPAGADAYVLKVEGFHAPGEDILVQVLTPPSTWTTRLTITATTDPNTDLTYTLTTGEFNGGSPSVRFVGASESGDGTQTDAFLDRVRIVRTYFARYQLDVRHDWFSIPAGGTYTLRIEAFHTDTEDFRVQVLTPPSTWTTRLTITATTDPNTDLTYTLTPEEYNGGAPSVRYVGAAESTDGTKSTLRIDRVRIAADFQPDFEMDAQYAWSGLPTGGTAYTLAIEAFRSPGEDILVQVLTPPSTWTTRLTITATTDPNTDLTYTLTTGEFNGGSPSVRFVGASESGDGAASDLWIDRLRVVRDSPPPNYRLEYQVSWQNEECADVREIGVEAFRSGEGIEVQVLSGAVWNTRLTIGATTDPQRYQTAGLSDGEWNGGSPRVRFVGTSESGDEVQDELRVDDLEVFCVGAGDAWVLANGAFFPQDVRVDTYDRYQLKFESETVVSRSWTHYDDLSVEDHDLVAARNTVFVRANVVLSLQTEWGTPLPVPFLTGAKVDRVTNESGQWVTRESRYFAVDRALRPGNYTLRIAVQVVEPGSDAIVYLTAFVPGRFGLEPWRPDADGDGLLDSREVQLGSNPFSAHSDRDGLTDFEEDTSVPRTSPVKEDTDGDGLWDGEDVGANRGERPLGTDPTKTDTDGDGLWDAATVGGNLGEDPFETDPTDWDTDDDTMPDGWEARYHVKAPGWPIHPRIADNASDMDADGLQNGAEYMYGTDPTDPDSDDDGLRDGDEVLGMFLRTNVTDGAISSSAYAPDISQWIVWNSTAMRKFRATDVDQGVERRLSFEGVQTAVDADGDFVVWTGFSQATGWDVYLFRWSTGQTVRITDDPKDELNPAVGGGYVVWQANNNTTAGWDIYAYRIADGGVLRLTTNESHQTDPAITDKFVVWVDQRHGNASNGFQTELYSYDLDRGVEVRLTRQETSGTENLPKEHSPDVYGTAAVWIDDAAGNDDVVLHELTGDTRLTNDACAQRAPRLGVRYVVWQDCRHGNADIYAYDRSARKEIRLTSDPADQRNPVVSGDLVAWEDTRNGNADVYLYNLATGVLLQVTSHVSAQTGPVLDGYRLAWADAREDGGDVFGLNLTLVMALGDGAPITHNPDRDELYVWKPGARFVRFEVTTSDEPITYARPYHGYRNRERFRGTDPAHPDTDRDGVYDGTEPEWADDRDDDGFPNAQDPDADGDGVPDGREVRAPYRTNALDGVFVQGTWVAVDLDLSDDFHELRGFMFNATSPPPSLTWTPIADLLTPQGCQVFYNDSNDVVRVGTGSPCAASHFNASDDADIELDPFALADYAVHRQQTMRVLSTDTDGVPDILDRDSDDDGILDGTEPLYYRDLDWDGLVNMLDLDSDGDGFLDALEDLDRDGVVDGDETSMISVDTDSDGIWDSDERDPYGDADGDGLVNANDVDADGDGVMDSVELRVVFRTNAQNGTFGADRWIALVPNLDAWNERSPVVVWGLSGYRWDAYQPPPGSGTVTLGRTPWGQDVVYHAGTDTVHVDGSRFVADSSPNIVRSPVPVLAFARLRQETLVFYWYPNPPTWNVLTNDSDGDGLLDGLEDLNGNGIIDSAETNPWTQDTDADMVPDGVEDANRNGMHDPGETKPLAVDTDGDGLWDGWQDTIPGGTYDVGVELGEDVDADGIVDAGETDPTLGDTDGDGILDGLEVRPNTHWHEAEDLAENVLEDPRASGGRAAWNESSSPLILHASQPLPSTTWTYRILVKARSTSVGASALVTASSGAELVQATLAPILARWEWYASDALRLTAATSVELWINDTSPGRPKVLIDKFLVVNVTGDEVDALQTTLTFGGSGGNQTAWLNIPTGWYVVGASLRFEALAANGTYDSRPDFSANYLNATESWQVTVSNTDAQLARYAVQEYDVQETGPFSSATHWENAKAYAQTFVSTYDHVDWVKLYIDFNFAGRKADVTVCVHYWFYGYDANDCQSESLYGSFEGNRTYSISDGYVGSNGYLVVSVYGDWQNFSLKSFPNNAYQCPPLDCQGYTSSDYSNFNPTGRDIWFQWLSSGYQYYYHTSGYFAKELSTPVGEAYLTTVTSMPTGTSIRNYVYDYGVGAWVDLGVGSLTRLDIKRYASPDRVKVKFVFSGTSTATSKLDWYLVSVRAFPSGVSLNVGGDRALEWAQRAPLLDEVIVREVQDSVNRFLASRADAWIPGQEISVPLVFRSASGGRIAVSSLSIRLEPYVSDPRDGDTDSDNIPDWYESRRYFSHALRSDSDRDGIADGDEVSGFGTHPGLHDTDGDFLWDGFEDLDGDLAFDPFLEVGEDVDLSGTIAGDTDGDGVADFGEFWAETNPRDPDSDDDRLLDGVEALAGVLWWEAERHTSNAPVADAAYRASASHAARAAPPGNAEVFSIPVTLAGGPWEVKVYVKARSSDGGVYDLRIYDGSAHLATLTVSGREYRWMSATGLEVTRSGSFSLRGESDASQVLVDTVMLARMPDLYVMRFVEGDAPHVLTYAAAGNQTVRVEVPLTAPGRTYVMSATLTISGSGVSDPRMFLRDSGNFTFNQWQPPAGSFSGPVTTLDLAGELNMYIARELARGPRVLNTNGNLEVELIFYSGSAGTLTITSVDIYLGPQVTYALSNDTDSDWMRDREEWETYGTSSLSWDSDNDGLYDVVEPVEGIGTNPTDSDSENDQGKDGDEVRVIFRVDKTSGTFSEYDAGTWLAVPDYMLVSLAGLGMRWVPFNPKGEPNTQSDETYYRLGRKEGNWSVFWHSTSGSAVSFTGRIYGDGTFDVLQTHFDPSDSWSTCAPGAWASCIEFIAWAGGGDASDGFNFTHSSGALRFELETEASPADRIYVGELEAKPPANPFEYHEVGLVGYGHVANVPDKPASGTYEIVYNGSFERRMHLVLGNASVYVARSGGGYAVYERGATPAGQAVTSLAPEMPYPLVGQEVYANSALVFDKDNDGIPDGIDPDPSDADIDDDGLVDGYEAYVLGTDLRDPDSDDDGLTDGAELGITAAKVVGAMWRVDINELIYGTNTDPPTNFREDADETTLTNPLKPDTDGDGLCDGRCEGVGEEVYEVNGKVDRGAFLLETDPLDPDTDGDGIPDGVERGVVGFDQDTATTTNPMDLDSDDDGLWDGTEDRDLNGKRTGTETDAAYPDTDGDGLPDGTEVGVTMSTLEDCITVPDLLCTDTSRTFNHFGWWIHNFTSDTHAASTTDPLDSDTDDDGIPDGWIDGWRYDMITGAAGPSGPTDGFPDLVEGEDRDLDGNADATETDGLVADTDGDGIPDGFEANDMFENGPSYALDPLIPDDAIKDYDDDLLSNLEEYETGLAVGHDPDDDGIVNHQDDNDDGDPWFTSWEVEWGLEPYANDSGLDLDQDGLNNSYEWLNQQFINLTAADSDGDGLNDGDEVYYWHVTRGYDEATALRYASIYDVDWDGTSDGQELGGYVVTVVWKEGEETKSQTIKVYGRPDCAYCDPDGDFLDVDGDGITDRDEVDPRNVSTAQAVKDFVALFGDNETLMNNTFQQFVRDEMPPILNRVEASSSAEFAGICPFCVPVHAWSTITVEAVDASDFTLDVWVLDVFKKVTFVGTGHSIFVTSIDIDPFGDYLVDYQVLVIATDAAGNMVQIQQDVDGILGALAEFLASIAAAIWGAIQAAVSAIAEALSWLMDLVVSLVMAVFEPALSAIRGAIEAIASPLVNSLERLYLGLHNTDSVSPSTLAALATSLASEFALAFGLLGVAIEIASLIALPFTLTFGMLISILVSLLVPLILNAILPALGSSDLGSTVSALLSGNIIDISALFKAIGISLDVPLSPADTGDVVDVLLILIFDMGVGMGVQGWVSLLIRDFFPEFKAGKLFLSLAWGLMAAMAVWLAGAYGKDPWVKFFGAIFGIASALWSFASWFGPSDMVHEEAGKFYKKPRPPRSSWHAKLKGLKGILLWIDILQVLMIVVMAINIWLAVGAFQEATG